MTLSVHELNRFMFLKTPYFSDKKWIEQQKAEIELQHKELMTQPTIVDSARAEFEADLALKKQELAAKEAELELYAKAQEESVLAEIAAKEKSAQQSLRNQAVK